MNHVTVTANSAAEGAGPHPSGCPVGGPVRLASLIHSICSDRVSPPGPNKCSH